MLKDLVYQVNKKEQGFVRFQGSDSMRFLIFTLNQAEEVFFMKRSRMLMLALLSALLFSIPFFTWGTGLLLMVAFVPLLFIEEEIASRVLGRKAA